MEYYTETKRGKESEIKNNMNEPQNHYDVYKKLDEKEDI